jgi:hypothetical protein
VATMIKVHRVKQETRCHQPWQSLSVLGARNAEF